MSKPSFNSWRKHIEEMWLKLSQVIPWVQMPIPHLPINSQLMAEIADIWVPIEVAVFHPHLLDAIFSEEP